MSNNGVQTAFELVPSKYGLFTVEPPVNTGSGDVQERWVRGFSQELESRPTEISNLDMTVNTAESIYTNTAAPGGTRYIGPLTPFFIDVEDSASTFGLLGEDRFARVLRILDAASEKAVELELWDGAISDGESYENPFLTGATSTTLNSGTAIAAKRALALLEAKIGSVSAVGEQGIIHMTRDVFSLLADGAQVHIVDGVAQTIGGTPIVVGSGYSGNGPASLGAPGLATDFAKWMYATGTLGVFLGESEVVNDTLSQGYGVSGNKNDMKIKATRPALAYFDTSIHLAVKVDLTVI